jgi:hypothetical protein
MFYPCGRPCRAPLPPSRVPRAAQRGRNVCDCAQTSSRGALQTRDRHNLDLGGPGSAVHHSRARPICANFPSVSARALALHRIRDTHVTSHHHRKWLSYANPRT